jgi:hypothetical protein
MASSVEVSDQKLVYIISIMHATRPSHLAILDFIAVIILGDVYKL